MEHRIRRMCERLQQYLVHHKHCYICRQSASSIVCDACYIDTALPHFPVPGFDLMQQPKVIEQIVVPYFHHFYALGEYAGILKPLINQLKFGNKPLAAQVLANFFVSMVYPRIALMDEAPDALIPIPLSTWRYSKRGYNQSRLLADAIGQLSHIPVLEALSRTRHTQAQSELNREHRLGNLHNAFSLRQDIPFEHIAIIDDVVTTGATVNSACKSLVDMYPDLTVSVWSIAVTPACKQEAQEPFLKQGAHVNSVRH